MAKRRNQNNPEELREKLVSLLTDFERELNQEDLRVKVLALVPVNNLLRDLGCSFITKECAATARDRILFYFRKYPRVIIGGEEIMVVAGISEWARRLRELRVQFGWSIISGTTAKEMAKEEDFGIDVSKMKTDDYVLLDATEDRDAAFRWNTANEIRRMKISIRDRILLYFQRNIGKPINGEELRYVADNSTEWARRVRELRTEFGWQIMTQASGMPELPVGMYTLISDRQAPEHDRVIKDQVRREVLQRDDYRCQECGWTHEKWNPSDPRHLEAHHIKQHVEGGENTVENLTTLCNICHDKAHAK
jgi:hypothetical protein